MLDRSELMLRLTHTLARLAPHDPLPTRLCSAFVEVVSASSGAISLGFSTSERTLLCFTSQQAARYEDAQDMARQGPSLDAFRTGEVIVSSTPEDQRRRWPGLVTLAGELPAQVHSIPMRPAGTVMGVLTVHHAAGTPIQPPSADLQFLTDAVGTAIVGDLPSPSDPSRLWTERDRVSQATGMVIAQLGLDAPDALAVLRAHAYAEESSLVAVSRRVVSRDLDFTMIDEDRP